MGHGHNNKPLQHQTPSADAEQLVHVEYNGLLDGDEPPTLGFSLEICTAKTRFDTMAWLSWSFDFRPAVDWAVQEADIPSATIFPEC
jgi:hypothetical protein